MMLNGAAGVEIVPMCRFLLPAFLIVNACSLVPFRTIPAKSTIVGDADMSGAFCGVSGVPQCMKSRQKGAASIMFIRVVFMEISPLSCCAGNARSDRLGCRESPRGR